MTWNELHSAVWHPTAPTIVIVRNALKRRQQTNMIAPPLEPSAPKQRPLDREATIGDTFTAADDFLFDADEITKYETPLNTVRRVARPYRRAANTAHPINKVFLARKRQIEVREKAFVLLSPYNTAGQRFYTECLFCMEKAA